MKKIKTMVYAGILLGSLGFTTSCGDDKEKDPKPDIDVTKDCVAIDIPKLVDKKWYRVGTNGTKWRIYKSDGKFEVSGNDEEYNQTGIWEEDEDTVNGQRINPCMVSNGNGKQKIVIVNDNHIQIYKDQNSTSPTGFEIMHEYRTTP